MQPKEARRLSRFLWPAALEGVCGGIIVSFFFVALGDLHPALALPLIGLGILGALARPFVVRDPARDSPSETADIPADGAAST